MNWLSSIEEEGGTPPSASSSTLDSSKANYQKGGEGEETNPESARVRLLEVGIWEEGSVTTGKAVCVRGSGEEAKVKIGEWIWRVAEEEGGFVPMPEHSSPTTDEGLRGLSMGMGIGVRTPGSYLSIDGFA